MSGSSSTGPAQGGSSSSAPAQDSSQTNSSRTRRSNAAAPTPATPAGALPFMCDDRNCCNIGGACDSTTLRICDSHALLQASIQPGRNSNGTLHNARGPEVCSICIPHERAAKLASLRVHATDQPGSGPLIRLCKDCIRNEMELYWSRVGRARPNHPVISPDMIHVNAWPTGPNPNDAQDLCICAHHAVRRFASTCCHACRNVASQNLHELYYQNTAEVILRTRTKAVITGKKKCRENDGQGTPMNANRRARFERMCPCGEKPADIPGAVPWISICLPCMGVRIDPRNIPEKYSQASIEKRVLRPRLSKVKKTKGPESRPMHRNFRVNIECGWLHSRDVGIFPRGDPFLYGQ
jgi:hypothetical protein